MTTPPAPPGIDVPKVSAWLAANVPGLEPPVAFSLISGGRSNLTYGFTDAAGVRRALRRPPTGGVLSTAHDMTREWRFISALADTPVPVPPPLAYCADTEVTGASFYVMGFVGGTVLGDEAAGRAFPEESRRAAAENTIDTMAALHRVDPHEVGLSDMIRPGGYVERQLRRWHRQVHASGADDLALFDEVHDQLKARMPEGGTGIVHGDFRPGNLCYAPDGTVTGVFDWELATFGEPLADLGWLISTWAEPGDKLASTPGPSTAPGFPGRDALVARYADATGTDVSDLPYYVAFNRWRAACIGAGVVARYRAGVMGDDSYDADARSGDVTRQAASALAMIRELT
ncbi:MAG: phosphotransferase [Streptosporangiales bacterium]|nr:phosphotransferase [Streptosporangiales bacterium]